MPEGGNNNGRVDTFSTVNVQQHQTNAFLPEVLSESQCNGPAHLMETIASVSPDDSHSSK